MTNALDRLAAPAPITQTTAVEQARAVAEVAAAVQVAQQNPRNLDRVWAEMRDACSRYGLASRAFYSVPNRGSNASVHRARELGRIWGNFDQGVHELHRDDAAGQSEVKAYAWDQQTNYRSSRTFQVPHAKMAGGQRRALTDLTDVYLNNQNVGARALRECIFAALPADFVDEAKDLCRKTLERGDGKPLDQRIADMVSTFAGIGVTELQIETRLKRRRSQWTPEDVADLGVVFRSIKRRETSVGDEFPAERVTADEITGQQRNPMDRDLHLFDEHQTARALASIGQQYVPGKAESQPITEFCGWETPDGACNLPVGHPVGPELPGYDGHDVVPGGGQ
ncbi:hypothetical protein ACTOB_001367 [Actinoplanes oblitus]|uniref:DUF222 domain-containing protein n=1 Tax=Actinoplanes oblitus TaxID=3040509 RepID=A0ABY8WMR7_9ACTN|nr:hypothetical protein [Actinoplanes oblitus]WIM97813.1 hypothetical protein ACTOB_001367 [Actinoplanes oblitus]